MWLITTQGFYSVVAHRDKADVLLVRARVWEDLEALREQIPALRPVETPDADYLWRAEVTTEEWAAAVVELAARIDYEAFKDAVAEDDFRSRVYFAAYVSLARLQHR